MNVLSSMVTGMPQRSFRTAAVAFALPLFAVAANAGDGLRISPGSWAITRLTRVPAESEPRLRHTIECIRTEVLDPAELAGEIGACRFVDLVLSDGTLTWRVRCGEAVAGLGELTVADSRAHGGVHVDDTALSQTGFSEMAWSANRVGPCPETFASDRDQHEPPAAPRQRAAQPLVRPNKQR